MVQMERLGATVLVNGPHAERCKDLMQRCSSTRLDRLGLLIGWRKDDSVSLMAASAGGQAITLPSMCLSNVFLIEDVGLTLSKPSSTFLARSMQIASVAQLAEVARLLSGKLNTIGFGNILAKESVGIHRAYESFGSEAPPDFLYSLDGQSINEMFAPILQSLHEDQTLCRIEGSREMAYIVSMLQVLFPHSLKITVEGIIIQDEQNPKIYIAI